MPHARPALVLGLIGLVLWPFSYAWIPNAGHNPAWMGWVIPVAEWGAIACAVSAIWLGNRARRAGVASLGAVWAPRLGWLTLGLMAMAFIAAARLYQGT